MTDGQSEIRQMTIAHDELSKRLDKEFEKILSKRNPDGSISFEREGHIYGRINHLGDVFVPDEIVPGKSLSDASLILRIAEALGYSSSLHGSSYMEDKVRYEIKVYPKKQY